VVAVSASTVPRRPIRVLPPDTAERIAAGEVIDRPAAAAKELIENALDAGARHIRVEVRGGGLELLRVTDDGCGIPATEVELAVARHATSKIACFEDLGRLTTLGFRGEALASIAAIGELTLSSAVSGASAGAGVTVRFGQVLERGTRARTPGTTVTVRDLFGNVPARRAFLKAQRVESARIGEVVRRYAVGRPDVGFTLVFDGRPAFHSAGDGDLRRVLAALYGPGAAEALAPLRGELPSGGRLHGLVGTGGPWHSGRQHVTLFVNGRWVRAGALPAAVEAAYRPFAPAGRHPLLVLFLEVPPDQIDANVHPAKLEVRLRDEEAVAEAIRTAVALAFGRTPAGAGASLSLQYRLPLARTRRVRRVAEPPMTYGQGGPPAEELPAGLRFLATARDGLIVAEADDGLYLVDQHRAHERVLFEALQAGAGEGPQALLEPRLVRPSPAQAALLAARAEELAALGFVLEGFGAGALVARAVPGALGSLDGEALAALLEAAMSDAADWRERLLATAACRAAVKKGQPLDAETARALLARLTSARAPAVCPHGAPVVVRLADGLLARLFRW
jgi:DNA mismatch repair protein MutL